MKLSLAGLITKNLVVEGTKLLLTRDVRDAFETVLPEIKSFFQTESETAAYTNRDSLPGGGVVGASDSFLYFDNISQRKNGKKAVVTVLSCNDSFKYD